MSCLVSGLFSKCQQHNWSIGIVLLLVMFRALVCIPQEDASVYWCVYNGENIFRMN